MPKIKRAAGARNAPVPGPLSAPVSLLSCPRFPLNLMIPITYTFVNFFIHVPLLTLIKIGMHLNI